MDEFTKSINIIVNGGGEESSSQGSESKAAKKEEKKKEDFRKRMGEAFKQQLQNIGNTIKDEYKKHSAKLRSDLKEIAKDAWKELANIASYNLNNSLFQTSTQRENALKYGLNNAENYALTKSMQTLGLQNEEDLFYMNDKQRTEFAKQMDKWTNFYEDAEQSGLFENIEEMQLEFKEFKDEIMIDIAQFFIENKDEIKNAIKFVVSALETIVKVLSAIASFVMVDTGPTSASERASKTSDIISNYSSNNSKNVNVKVDNTFNGIETKNQSTLLNAGELTYKQIIESLK